MRSLIPSYELVAPHSVDEALGLMAQAPGVWKPFAGGTDLMVLLEAGKLEHHKYFSIWNLPELRGIEETPEHITLGTLTTYTQVQQNATLQCEFPLLCAAAHETGGIATQNRGTLGGNIVNASPAADSPPALLVYDAEVELVSARGARWVPYHTFHTGYKKMLLREDELLRRIRLPRNPRKDRLDYYRKVGTRKAQAISKVCLAVSAQMKRGRVEDCRIALGSVAPIPLRCTHTEALIAGQAVSPQLVRAARQQLLKEINTIDDMRSTADYRSRVAQNLLQEFLNSLNA